MVISGRYNRLIDDDGLHKKIGGRNGLELGEFEKIRM